MENKDQGCWRMGGILREIYLLGAPKAYIRGLRVSAPLGEAYSTGFFGYLFKTPNEIWGLPGTLEALRADGVQIVVLGMV